MRSIWKGAISFGLVTIPVKLYSATEQRDVTFHQVHRADGGRIRYRRVCQIDGQEVPYSDIAKGYELATGEEVVLTDDDFADLPLSTSRTVEVMQFAPEDQVDPIFFSKSYYLEPEAAGTKPYALLREALERSGKVAIVKIALRQRESLGTLRVREGVFVLETMLWPDEVRTPDFEFLDEDIDVRSQELKMATSLISEMTEDFDPTQYHDAYREALQEVIDAKIAGREVVQPETPDAEEGPSVDLMSALRASVDAAKKGREKPSGDGQAAGRKASSSSSRTRSGGDGGRSSSGGKSSSGSKSSSGGTSSSSGKSSSGGRSATGKTSSSRKKSSGETTKRTTRKSA